MNRPEPVLITEIIGPAEQGLCGPYLCLGEDGHLYFVKGRNSGRRSQIAEWICGYLGKALDLPLAPFAQVLVLPELLAETKPDWRELGAGIAFGSREHPKALWFEIDHVGRVPEDLQRDILMFDWWIRNGDRLTSNSNLRWDAAEGRVVVIDHNQAFDGDFVARDFLSHHIFHRQAERVFDDFVERMHYAKRLGQALSSLDDAMATLPAEWWWFDDEETVPADFDLKAARGILQLCESDMFWSMA